jgi:hypothetical protein
VEAALDPAVSGEDAWGGELITAARSGRIGHSGRVGEPTWIFVENLLPFLFLLSARLGYDFDDSDAAAIRLGIGETDPDEGRWYEYPLVGRETATVRLAQEAGSGVVLVAIDAPSHESYCRAVMDVMQLFFLARERVAYDDRWTV